MELNKFQESLKDINQAIELEPNNGNFYHLRSAIKAMMGDEDGSCSDMKMAVKLGNDWGDQKLKITLCKN